MTKKIIKKVVDKEKINYEIPAYILGIVSIVLAFISPFAGLALSIIGLVQSDKQKTLMSKKAKRLNIVGLIISGIMVIVLIIFSAGTMSNFPAY